VKACLPCPLGVFPASEGLRVRGTNLRLLLKLTTRCLFTFRSSPPNVVEIPWPPPTVAITIPIPTISGFQGFQVSCHLVSPLLPMIPLFFCAVSSDHAFRFERFSIIFFFPWRRAVKFSRNGSTPPNTTSPAKTSADSYSHPHTCKLPLFRCLCDKFSLETPQRNYL